MNEFFQQAHSDRAMIAHLLPTQVTVGMREVDIKRASWREKDLNNAAHYLGKLCVPVVLGPGKRYYMIDRHHLTMALYEEGIVEVPISIVDNIAEFSFDKFWKIM